ncbi:helix-turn-helix domain-containing protein [Streptomyces arenae]|uniref:helix-turn-helix domain-containing protein n=1 Tax=Streptomyces arenae TaxID=29301 RepID=UPI002659C10A|nr:helix-turn-helix domain-containing protein [Streptomyces arenae]MCG7205192.1 helix-turn-helix domain-containing protein [Streptomyces arenae]
MSLFTATRRPLTTRSAHSSSTSRPTWTTTRAQRRGQGDAPPPHPSLHRAAGAGPGRYVRQVRTEAAAHVLASTTLPMAGVAARCGFGSAETLRQALTERFGIAPSHYRAAMRPV